MYPFRAEPPRIGHYREYPPPSRLERSLVKSFDSPWQAKDRRDHVSARINFRQLAFYFVFFQTQPSLWRGGGGRRRVDRQNTQQIKHVTTAVMGSLTTVKPAPKRPCEDLVAAYGRWSIAGKYSSIVL